MLNRQTVSDYFQTRISGFTRETLIFLCNFLILEKITKLNSMTELSLNNYIKNKSINGMSTTLSPNELKKQMILELINNSHNLQTQGMFALRSETMRYLNYFQEDSSTQMKLINKLISIK